MNQKKPDLLHQIKDEVNEDVHPLLKKITENIKTIGLIIGLIILVAAGYTGFKQYQAYQIKKAKQKLDKIYSLEDANQLKKLETYLSKAPGSVKNGIILKLANLCMELNQPEKAVDYWEKLEKNVQSKHLQIIAKLGKAKSLNLQEKFKESITILKDMQKKAPESYLSSINYLLAQSAEKSKQWSLALNTYQELKKQAELGNKNQEFLDYKIAKLKEKTGPNKNS